MKKHDENKCVRAIYKIARVNGKIIEIAKNAIIGIHTWGKIDYLVKYCGYVLIRTNPTTTVVQEMNSNENYKAIKKELKQQKQKQNHKQTLKDNCL